LIRLAAHLGISRIDRPLLAASAGSADPVAQIACAARLGFAGVTDNGLKLRDAQTQRLMGEALRTHGLEMGTFTFNALGGEAPFHWGSAIPDVEGAMADLLAAAAHVGGGCINAILLDDGSAPADQIARATDNLARAVRIAAREGVGFAVEASSRARVPGSLIPTARETAVLVRAAGTRLILDSCHCHCSGEDMGALIQANGDILAAVQLADMPGRVEPGAGEIDFGPIMAALEAIGWHGLVEGEFDAARSGADGEGDAVAALGRLG